MNSEQLELWKITSSQKSQNHILFSGSNSPILDSNHTPTTLLLCPPLQFHPKLGLTNLIFNSLTRNPNLEEQLANQLGITSKEYLGKFFEGRYCSICSIFLKELVPPSDHPLVECLEALYLTVVGDFSQILDPEFENGISTFEETLMGAMRTYICEQ